MKTLSIFNRNLISSLSVSCSLLVLLIGFSACEDVVEIQVPEASPQLVVDGSISNRAGRQEVKLSWSTAYFEESTPPLVQNAQVLLKDDEGREELMQLDEKGTYYTDIPGEVGRSYWLEISLEDGRAYRSMPETLFPVSAINGVQVVREDEEEEPDEEGKFGYSVLLTSYQPLDEVNFYRWKVYVNDTLESKADDLSFARDDFVSEQVIDVEIFGDLMRPGDKVRVEQLSITERYYDFLTVLFQQTVFVGGLFDPPPAPIRGNIVNKDDQADFALGYFYAAAIEEGETVIE